MILKSGRERFAVIILVLLLTNLVILLDIPFLRQIFGFLFLTILPGLLILHILKLNKIGFTEKVVLGVGLSISFLMLFCVVLNNLSLSLDYKTPLATIPLLVSLNIAFIVLAIIGLFVMRKNLVEPPMFASLNFCKTYLSNLNLSRSEKAFLIFPIFFPALSILGTHFMKTWDNNLILIFLLFLIPIYVVFVCFFNPNFSKRLYPIVIFLITISLLLIFMLRFPHIVGHDVHMEYGIFFQPTLDNLHWRILRGYALDACLSITLLPTIFQSIMNVNAQEYLFKTIYVSTCSFTPLAVYIVAKKYVDESYAFLASFFFISEPSFLSLAGSPRTYLAIFFVAVASMVLFNDKIEPVKKRIIFIVFLLSITVTHYSSAYIFFFITICVFVGTEILLRRSVLKKTMSLTIVLLFFVFIFFWYSQVTDSAFRPGVEFIGDTFASLNRFFIEESRTEMVTHQLVGEKLAYPLLSAVILVITWSTFILIAIGVFTMIWRYKEMKDISNVKYKKPDFLKTEFELEFLVFVLASVGLLLIMVALPYISKGYDIHRLYSLVAVFLSLCFVMGGITLSRMLSKYLSFSKKALPKKQKEGQIDSHMRAYIIILLILVPYSMFMTGVMYQIFGAHVSLNLNSEGEFYSSEIFTDEYVYDSESSAAKWLMSNHEKDSRIYTSGFGARTLMSQGKILPNTPSFFPDHRINILPMTVYFYLYYTNTVKGKVKVKGQYCNMTDYSDWFIGINKIYNSGGSEIWKS